MAAIERVAIGLDAREEVLAIARLVCGAASFMGLLGVEHCPIVGPERARCGIRFGASDLREMPKMTDPDAGAVGSAGTGHINGNRLLDAAALYGVTKTRSAADLLGHGENLEPVLVRFALERAGIGFDRVEIEHVGIGRDLAGLVQRHGCFDEARIAAAENVEKHCCTSASLFAQRHGDCDENDETANDHLIGNRKPHEDEAIVEHAHEKRAN